MELTEAYTIALPAGHSVSGARSSTPHLAIAWSNSEPHITRVKDGRSSLLKNKISGRVVAAELSETGDVEAWIATDEGAVYSRFDSSGNLLGSKVLQSPVIVSGAMRLDRSWYLGGTDVAKGFRVYKIDSTGTIERVLSIPRSAGARDTGAVAAHLSASGSDLIVTLGRHPYTVWRVSPSSGKVVLTNPRDDRRIDSVLAAVNRPAWVGLRGVAIDSGTLHTLSDLASDTRLVFVLGHDGQVLLVKAVAAPIGFVDSNVAKRRLCAVRTLNIRELVCYTWRWTQE